MGSQHSVVLSDHCSPLQDCVSPYLLSAVDDILGVGQAVDAGPANHRVVSGGGVGHLHGAELEEGLP